MGLVSTRRGLYQAVCLGKRWACHGRGRGRTVDARARCVSSQCRERVSLYNRH